MFVQTSFPLRSLDDVIFRVEIAPPEDAIAQRLQDMANDKFKMAYGK
jgi:hypothetical protein